MEDIEDLKSEIIRLTNELDKTASEKSRAGEYGLVLLQEKDELERR